MSRKLCPTCKEPLLQCVCNSANIRRMSQLDQYEIAESVAARVEAHNIHSDTARKKRKPNPKTSAGRAVIHREPILITR